MNHLLNIALRLYPAWWRKRYGDEFDAFLDEARPGIFGVLDILKGALAMRFSNPGNPLRILGMTTVLGLVAVAIFGLAAERQFRSTATVAIAQTPNYEYATHVDMGKRLQTVTALALSRTSLSQIANDHDLYPQLTDADRLKRMKEGIEIRVVSALPDMQDRQSAFDISFSHPDRDVANGVVRDLTSRLLDTNAGQVGQDAGEGLEPAFKVLDSASLPDTPIQPAWGGILAAGFVGGLGLGLVLILVRRLTRGAKLPQNGPPVPTEN